MNAHTILILGFVLTMWTAAWNLPSVTARQTVLLLASYFFYGSWGLGFLSILIASSLANFYFGSLLRRRLTPGYLWLGIGFNLLLLGFFKYLPPISEGGLAQSELARRIIMPVGISFWTFQALSYLVDTYLEEEVDPSILEFCLYMAFWPTVLSGPVCRLPKTLPQFRKEPGFSSSDISAGALCLAQGLFMKLYLAQLLAIGWSAGQGVTAGFDQVKSGWGGIDVWLLGIGFGFLLFFDFAGYSLMAIGVARLFGIQVAENFNRPFLATTPSGFWTRWHMSLSFWIRDYVFKPLALARRDWYWPYAALVISMALFGLWHGAKWTFILFGFYHGMLLVMHRVGQQLKPRLSIRLPRYLGMSLAWGTTFLMVSLGFVLFRANNLTQAFSMWGSVFSPRAYLHFAMPRNFYFLISAVALGYFAFIAGYSVLMSCRAHYAALATELTQSAGGLWQLNLSKSPLLLVGALVEFFTARLWWWFAPALVCLTVVGAIAVYTQNAAITVTPFIYTLF